MRNRSLSPLNEISVNILTGVVTNIENRRGFAFATTQTGEDFFLNITKFEDPEEWDKLRLRSIVVFTPSERFIPGKSRAAKDISIQTK